MINEHLIGIWWLHKTVDYLFTYKGPSPPRIASRESASFPDDAETGWLQLSGLEDSCYVRNSKGKIFIHTSEFCNVVDMSLLNDMQPGDITQIEIFPSGNWVMYD